MKLAGRTVAITGAAGGIGRALALRCAAEGARVAASDLDASGVAGVGAELGAGHLALAADVTDEAALGGWLERAEAELGPVEVFFANAGVAIGTDPLETPDDVWESAYRINVWAHVLAARRLLPGWLERGRGYFVATASAAGLLTQVGSAPYAVTKHGAVAFAEWLSVTYGERGIRVSCLCPMGVRTAMLQGEELGQRVVRDAGVVLEPEEVADAVIAGIDSERFLILPHAEVLTFFQRKALDYERWLAGMRRMQGRVDSAGGDGLGEDDDSGGGGAGGGGSGGASPERL